MNKKQKIYNFVMALLAMISIAILFLDYASVIDLNAYFWIRVDNGILLIFALDYFVRLLLAKNKRQFFKKNIFDLLSIIPVNGIFAIFRISRIARFMRIMKILRVLRLVGLTGRINKFLHTNGLNYLLYLSFSLLIMGSVAYSVSENVSIGEGIWWALATATTVGYGDISPHTLTGKIVAMILMFVGIGVIGSLTSAITTYFINNDDEANNDEIHDNLNEIMKKLDKLERQNSELREEISYLKSKRE